MANTDNLASVAKADLEAAETFLVKWVNLLMGYIPKTWQRIAAAAVLLLIIWNWGYWVAAGAVSVVVPEGAQQAMLGVLPATNNALAQTNAAITKQDQKLASSSTTLVQKIDSLTVSLANVQRALASIVNQGLAVENRVDAIESKITDPTTTGSLSAKRHKSKSQ